ncbi:hypothetical protein GWK47_018818 [Chionoecetes opilio]|uniref:Uncharacterized protein n=1 Tax=Chionoecetes opilio TaxID=41210 RepID=A0A8J5CGA9_CHIOP|nr:hypothetical protein GWK47_018818 [Chionoecetes opilio]
MCMPIPSPSRALACLLSGAAVMCGGLPAVHRRDADSWHAVRCAGFVIGHKTGVAYIGSSRSPVLPGGTMGRARGPGHQVFIEQDNNKARVSSMCGGNTGQPLNISRLLRVSCPAQPHTGGHQAPPQSAVLRQAGVLYRLKFPNSATSGPAPSRVMEFSDF